MRVATQGGPIRLLDARPPTNWTVAEVEEALERHKQRSGALVAFVAASVAAQWERIRGELNRLAGGQASDRVMALAHYAEMANYAVDIQRYRLEAAVGEEAKGADAAVRDFTGLTAVAAQRLNEAFDLAEREGKRGNPVDGLMTSLGVGQPVPGVPTVPSPASTPAFAPGGGSTVGPPPPSKPERP